jgi:hypothetical protein
MSDQSFYLELTFRPKAGTRISRITGQHQVIVEVPKSLVRSELSKMLAGTAKEESIALRLARSAALHTFLTVPEGIAQQYHEDAIWCEDRPAVMNRTPCDYEENGTKAWRIDPES